MTIEQWAVAYVVGLVRPPIYISVPEMSFRLGLGPLRPALDLEFGRLSE